MIEVFERAKCKKYADEVRKIVQIFQLSSSKTVHSSEEHSQPPVYPASDEPQSLSQVPPAMHKPVTEVYVMREGTPPEGTMFANYMILHNAVSTIAIIILCNSS